MILNNIRQKVNNNPIRIATKKREEKKKIRVSMFSLTFIMTNWFSRCLQSVFGQVFIQIWVQHDSVPNSNSNQTEQYLSLKWHAACSHEFFFLFSFCAHFRAIGNKSFPFSGSFMCLFFLEHQMPWTLLMDHLLGWHLYFFSLFNVVESVCSEWTQSALWMLPMDQLDWMDRSAMERKKREQKN